MRGLVSVVTLLCAAVLISAAAAPGGQVARGNYLVNQVAMCVQCHTPRDANGDLDRTQLLQGAPVPVSGPFPAKKWAFRAPAIAGLPGWSDDDAITLLTTGHRLNGYMPNPPMPPFRMSREDAEAVVAYLRSLR